jgi:hypothetical protein
VRRDPLPSFCLKLELDGRSVEFLPKADFPTETAMTLDFSRFMSAFAFKWISGSLQSARPMPGNLVTLDTSFREIYRDAWDFGFIRQIRLPGVDIHSQSSSGLGIHLAVQIANLRQVPTGAGPHTGNGGGIVDLNWNACFPKVTAGDFSVFVPKIGALTITLGPNTAGMEPGTRGGRGVSNLVMTMKEIDAAGFRNWKQSGGQRDVTVQFLNASLKPASAIKYTGVTIDHIHPAAPINPLGDTEVTMKIGWLIL